MDVSATSNDPTLCAGALQCSTPADCTLGEGGGHVCGVKRRGLGPRSYSTEGVRGDLTIIWWSKHCPVRQVMHCESCILYGHCISATVCSIREFWGVCSYLVIVVALHSMVQLSLIVIAFHRIYFQNYAHHVIVVLQRPSVMKISLSCVANAPMTSVS